MGLTRRRFVSATAAAAIGAQVYGLTEALAAPPRRLTGLLPHFPEQVGSSRVDLQACKLEYSIVSPK